MRFCLVTTFYPPFHFGGDAVFVQSLARALVTSGHEVEVVHCEDAFRVQSKNPPPSPGADDGVVVHRLKSRLGALSPLISQQTGRPGIKSRKLRAILARDFDIVNFHNISLMGGPRLLALSRAPVNLYTFHDHWLLCPTHVFWKNRRQACDRPQCLRCCLRSGLLPQLWRYGSLTERSLRHVDAFLAPSEFTADRHRAAGIPRVEVMPTFSSLDPGPPGKLVAPERPRFLYVGRITGSKGVRELVAEFMRRPRFDLVIVGDGDLRPELETQASGAEHVRFLGRLTHDRVVDEYRRATALILHSSAPEVFPLCVLEAFACGTPALVRDAGGAGEAVRTTGGGIVYGASEELDAALEIIAGEPSRRDELARRARRGFEEHYSVERHLDRFLGRIGELMRGKRPAGMTGVRQQVKVPSRLPLVGHLPAFLRDKLGFLTRCAAGREGAVRLDLGGPTWLLLDPDDIKHVLVSNGSNYDKSRRMTSDRGRTVSGWGLLTASGPEHLRQRKLLQPIFHRKAIDAFASVVAAATARRLEQWKDGDELNVTQAMSELTQEVILDVVFGPEFALGHPHFARAASARREYFEYVFLSLLPMAERLPTRARRRYARSHRVLREVLFEEIQNRRHSPGPDLLSQLVNARYPDNSSMSDEQVFDEALTLCVTGYETIGEALGWTWFLLATAPEAGDHVAAEAREILQDRRPAADDVPRLEYTRRVMDESLRIYPPTWIYVRMARNRDRLPSGAEITPGGKVYLSQYVVHRSPRFFPQPERFDPDRFSENAIRSRPVLSYFPFGAGTRACIGKTLAYLEGPLILADLARSFRFELLPDQDVVPVPGITLRPKRGIRVRVRARR